MLLSEGKRRRRIAYIKWVQKHLELLLAKTPPVLDKKGMRMCKK